MLSPDFVLSDREFDILAGDLGLGRPPYPLDVPSVGQTVEQRDQFRDEVYRELANRDLAAGDRMDAELAGLLRLLFHHEISVDAVGHVGQPVRAVATADQHGGVLAVQEAEKLWLTEIRPTSLAKSIVEVLPVNEPGPGGAMSMPYQALATAIDSAGDENDDDDPFGGDVDERVALTRAGVSTKDAATLIALANNRLAGGQFGVSVGGRGRSGAQRASTLVTWFDTHEGRYLMVREDSWLSIAPADNERIEHRIATVLSQASPEIYA